MKPVSVADDHSISSGTSIVAPAQPKRRWKSPGAPSVLDQKLEQRWSLDSEIQRTETKMNSTTHNHLEDALYKFLQQANLLQYYSAFLEQGKTDHLAVVDSQRERHPLEVVMIWNS